MNLRQVTRTPLPNPRFHYVTGRAAVLNNTHTVVAKAGPGSTITVGGTTFRLLQIHFHVHSEHEVNGHVYPVEVHFVHQTRTGELAALGVFVRRGSSTNRAWQPYVRSLDVAPGRTVHPRIDWAAMLPRDRESFCYHGSLTTPPCTEGLRWVVLTQPVRLSGGQIAAFRAAYAHNYRPLQPLHGRTIFLGSNRGR